MSDAGQQSIERLVAGHPLALARLKELVLAEARYRRITWLIGSIFVHGNFTAETANERELESLLRATGNFWETLAAFDKALAEGGR